MPKINLLDKHTAELIAAGEVIERPSSVVKELVENAIDAGASVITVEIKNGGVRLIRITDNGCGIEREDIPTAFLRHATSKVSSEDDLYRIATLGFRGEALASVCAVSRVELLSRAAGCNMGYSYKIEGGEELGEPLEAGCPQGVSIYVRDLFYNIPARMKFLKKDITEGNAVATLLDRLALSHPEVSFRFIRDGQLKLQTPGDGKLLSAIHAVYGKEFGSSLIAVSGSSGGVEVGGYIGKPELAKASRTMQHFFINNRYVRCVTAMAALEESYKNGIMVGKHPGCVLNITLAHGNVDVNVHPAKLEVKLNDERAVFDAVYHACRTALMSMKQGVAVADTASRAVKDKLSYMDLTNRPLEGEQQHMTSAQYRENLTTGERQGKSVMPPKSVVMRDNAATSLYIKQLKESNIRSREPIVSVPAATRAFGQRSDSVIQKSAQDNDTAKALQAGNTQMPYTTGDSTGIPVETETAAQYCTETRSIAFAAESDISEKAAPEQTTNAVKPKPQAYDVSENHVQGGVQSIACQTEDKIVETGEPEMRLLGEAFCTYLIAQQGDKLMLVDKHAAHERILFEQLNREYESGEVSRQLLLETVRLSFSKDLYDALISNTSLLESLGFLAEDFGGGSLIVREIPTTLPLDCLEDSMLELGEKLMNGASRPKLERIDDMLHSIACKAAVKGGSFTGEIEQKKLLELLQNDKTLRSCPHGRPIMIELTRREIEKMFGRIV